MISPYRVLDLTDHRGELAGMILGSLGADVIKVEPPGGCPGRRQGPFADGERTPESSLHFFAHNRFKRSIILDLASTIDRETFFALIETADIVIDSAPPGLLASNGITHEDLVKRHPTIVQVTITPYGIDGPAATRPASDLTIAAMGGQVALQGTPEREPVRVTAPQVWRHAGVEGAVAALVGHRRMLVTGEPQFVDISAQCAVTWTLQNAMNAHAIQGFDYERMGSTLQGTVATIAPLFSCADGYLIAIPNGGTVHGLLGSLLGEEVVDESWLHEEWATIDARRALGEETKFSPQDVRSALERFFALHTRAELFAIGLEIDVVLAPVNSVADVLEFEPVKEHDAFHRVPFADGPTIALPGNFANVQRALPLRSATAPRLDQHGEEIRRELETTHPVKEPRAPRPAGSDRPFDGLKVLDLTWVIAGPVSARYLADHGATVVKVESEARPDGIRRLGPLTKLENYGWNSSHFYGDFNAGKECIRLNLKQPAALPLLKRLIAWADVLVMNWAPGAADRAGIGYNVCRDLNPDLIMLNASLMGSDGPAASVAGYGYHAAGMAGFYDLTGWPDLPPDGAWGAYTDIIVPRFVAVLLLAAIDHRRRTGEGQYIDASQFDMALHFLAPEMADYQVNGHLTRRMGNRSRFAAPHGVYPTAGEDEWCAIAVLDDGQWQALRALLGGPDWSLDPALEVLPGRLAARDLIDRHLAAWTRARRAPAAMQKLAERGIPAGVVQRSKDLAADPQYAHRGFHRRLDHPEMGNVPYAGTQFRIRGYDAGPHAPAPLFGEHSEKVLSEIVGLSQAEIADLVERSVVR